MCVGGGEHVRGEANVCVVRRMCVNGRTAVCVKQSDHVLARRGVLPDEGFGQVRGACVVVDADGDGGHAVVGQQRNHAAG